MERQTGPQINNAFYDELGEKWYTEVNHPIALLRAENAFRVPWIIEMMEKEKTGLNRVLDVGCGAGILTNALAKKGHEVHGIDLSSESLKIAALHDATKTVRYQCANAYHLSYSDKMFDVVTAMDVLEHVENPAQLIREAGRVLKSGGLFFFHTFNRNLLSFFIVIKGVEWFVPNAPKNMHVYPLFIKPKELHEMLQNQRLTIEKMHGFRPEIFSFPFLKMLLSRTVPKNFRFCFSKSLATGYCGYAKKI